MASLQPGSALVQTLKGLAIVGSFWNAGTMTTAWRFLPATYPTTFTSRKLATKQWEFYYWAMSATVPLADLATFLICGGLAYSEHKASNPTWKIWAAAAGVMPFGWAWVRLVMLPPSNAILKVSQAEDVVAESFDPRKVNEMLKQFNWQMGVRALWPWVVGGLTLWASLRE